MFYSKEDLATHFAKNHGAKVNIRFPCTTNKKDKNDGWKNRKKSFSPKGVDSSDKAAFASPSTTDTKEEPNQCHYCDKTFPSLLKLVMHQINDQQWWISCTGSKVWDTNKTQMIQ